MVSEQLAGRPLFWAIMRGETTNRIAFVLQKVKQAMEEGQPEDFEWKPSCVLVDNSDAEIGAIRCAKFRQVDID